MSSLVLFFPLGKPQAQREPLNVVLFQSLWSRGVLQPHPQVLSLRKLNEILKSDFIKMVM